VLALCAASGQAIHKPKNNVDIQVLEVKGEAPELVAALHTLSSVYHENTPASRRGLRSAIEKRSLEISDSFIEAAEAVILVRVCVHVSEAMLRLHTTAAAQITRSKNL
jgi:hypothetical protein